MDYELQLKKWAGKILNIAPWKIRNIVLVAHYDPYKDESYVELTCELFNGNMEELAFPDSLSGFVEEVVRS